MVIYQCKDTTLYLKIIVFYGEYLFYPFKTIISYYSTAIFITHGDKIIYCAMYLYVGYVNETTNFAESQGGSDTKDWGHEKDEDEIEWIKRCLRQATRMVKQRKSTGGGKMVNDQM